MKAKVSVLFVMVISIFFSMTTNVFADDEGLPFEIKPKLTYEQKEGITSYFSIEVDGNSKQETFEFSIKNKTDEPKDVLIGIMDAYTSPNGVVQYVKEETEDSIIIDEKYKISTHLKLDSPNKISLEGGEEKIIKATLDAEDVEGVLLGGLSFEIYEDEEEIEQEATSFTIKNKINMVLGVMIEFDTDKDVNLTLEKPYIDPMPSYYAIRLPITMNSPFFKEANIDYEVVQDGEVLFDGEAKYDLAPMSKVNASLPWEAENIKSKEIYTLKGVIKYNNKDGEPQEEEFEFTFNYVPENDVIEKITTALKRPMEENSTAWIIVVSTGLVLIAIAVLVLRKKNLYVLVHSGELPQKIYENDSLYKELIKKPKDIDEKEFGVYKRKKNSDGYYYELYYREVHIRHNLQSKQIKK